VCRAFLFLDILPLTLVRVIGFGRVALATLSLLVIGDLIAVILLPGFTSVIQLAGRASRPRGGHYDADEDQGVAQGSLLRARREIGGCSPRMTGVLQGYGLLFFDRERHIDSHAIPLCTCARGRIRLCAKIPGSMRRRQIIGNVRPPARPAYTGCGYLPQFQQHASFESRIVT
jgi:hypothetical protein